MQLVYYRRKLPNFGDDLNAALWPALAPGLFDEDPETGFVGIGTIIGMECGAIPRLHVFSSGVGYDLTERWRGREVTWWCVRGPVSARRLGLEEDRALTDGAILTPLAEGFPRAASGTGGVALIPHWETLHHPGWDEVARLTGYAVIDPRGEPAAVIARIAAARLVITESLHGAILADTYGVPWIAFAASKNFSITKWVDWTLSVGCACRIAMVPPPDAGVVLAYGRAPAPYGEVAEYDMAAALDTFAARLAPPPASPLLALRTQAKGLAKRSPLLRRLLGYGPARTAEALARLARSEPQLSDAGHRAALRDRMMERLGALAAAHGRQPVA